MKPRITFELSQSLLEQIQRYAEENDMKIAAICRKATKEFTAAFRVVEPITPTPAPEPAIAEPDDNDSVGAHGYTKAELKAKYAEMEAREKARQVLPPHKELMQRQHTLDEWAKY